MSRRYLPMYGGPLPHDIPEAFGYQAPWRCARCGPIQEIEGVETLPASWNGPSEGYDYCALCGSMDVSENDDPAPFRAIRRWKIRPTIRTAA